MSILWKPEESEVKESTMYQFADYVALEEKNFPTLYDYSIKEKCSFWIKLIEFFGVEYSGSLEPACIEDRFLNYPWFPQLKLNFAQNLLMKGLDEDIALNFVHESGLNKKLTYKQLKENVAALQQDLKGFFSEGDVFAAYMPNCNETVVAMCAATSLGGVFTSTSCDFGVSGVVDRFGQSKPKVLIAASHYEYNGKVFDLTDKIRQITGQVSSIEKVYIVDIFAKKEVLLDDNWFLLREVPSAGCESLTFTHYKFSQPLYIMYSSGTTGKPKCIVHSAGGTLIQHLKELGLHANLTKDKNIMYFTTCGWMMWNWLISALALGASVTLYEGSPGYPSLEDFFSIIDEHQIHIFGTSPKFLKALEQNFPDKPKWHLKSLETLLSTGAPLLAEQFDFIYEKIKKDLRVSSICGGTDIISCFMLGNPFSPVIRGQIQGPGLGMEISCFDDQGRSHIEREGELVCKSSFPSIPLGFLNDENNQRFKSSYFERFPGVWHHGDYISLTKDKGVEVFGRSDSTLNPGGVRIGTAEIYRQVEKIRRVKDSLCVGKKNEGDVDVWLYVQMIEGEDLTKDLELEIRQLIKANTSPRHIPKKIMQIKGIPYTRSGKKMEIAITKLINGKKLDNIEAVSNPECLDEYLVL